MTLTKTIEKHLKNFVSPGAPLLVAISGGPDSVALAHVLKSLGFSIFLGHIDHQMRKDSQEDARFVQRLAVEWDLPCFVARVDVPSHAAIQRMGLEEAARELRYEALVKMARRAGRCAIVTAHHAGDQAETVVMNFLRGTGPTGLAGISPVRTHAELPLLRPLLSVERSEILSYLKINHLRFRRDPTNHNRRFMRNRIRHEVLPSLSSLYPGLAARLGQLADITREEEDFWTRKLLQELSKTVRKDKQRIVVDLPHLLGYHKAVSRRILRACLPGLSFQEIERVFGLAQSTDRKGHVHLAGGWLVTRSPDTLIMKHLKRKA